MTAYYNEFDKSAAAWLRELIKDGQIAHGEVDERSIEDVRPSDLLGFTQCHFFAGIGGWSLALRTSGWPDDRPVWTGSCPCQPFSAAGKGGGFDDERHLWPHLHYLIAQCRPPKVYGEQVASRDGLDWLDLVRTDLEVSDYAVAATDICAAGVGAPHIRQRLYWVADRDYARLEGSDQGTVGRQREAVQRGGGAVGLADAEGDGQQGGSIRTFGWVPAHRVTQDGELGGMEHAESIGRVERRAESSGRGVVPRCCTGGLADADISQQRPNAEPGSGHEHEASGRVESAAAVAGLCGDHQRGPTNGVWRDADWLGCRDGKWRPVEPGTFPLVDGLLRGVVPSSRIGMEIDANKTAEGRVMRLRGYGNAIVPQAAAVFVRATS